MRTVWSVVPIVVAGLLTSCQSEKPAASATVQAPAVKEIAAAGWKSWSGAVPRPLLIDVREETEWKEGHAAGAVHVRLGAVEQQIASVAPDKAAKIVLYCRSGKRSARAAATLQQMGYTNVFSLAGGIDEYRAAGLPVER